MIHLSGRHAPWLLVAVGVLLAPLAVARFEVRRHDDCQNPERALEIKGLPFTRTFSERLEKYDEDVPQWTQAEIDIGERGVELRGALVRSFDAIRLYTRPPGILLGQFEAGQREVEHVEVDGKTLPIQTIIDRANGRRAVASYLFVFGGEPVRHPSLAQLKRAPELVLDATRPLTLLIAGGPVMPGKLSVAREKTRDWLIAAYRHQRDACFPDEAR